MIILIKKWKNYQIVLHNFLHGDNKLPVSKTRPVNLQDFRVASWGGAAGHPQVYHDYFAYFELGPARRASLDVRHEDEDIDHGKGQPVSLAVSAILQVARVYTDWSQKVG